MIVIYFHPTWNIYVSYIDGSTNIILIYMGIPIAQADEAPLLSRE
eukprot:SAG31_NODE_40736_length_279_cov_0.850000_2_plen_44_part_01